MNLTPLLVSHRETSLEFRSDMLACDDHCLRLVSCAGSGVAIRAMAAALRSKETVLFQAPRIFLGSVTAASKYRFRYAKLALDSWHLLAVEDNPRFLLELTDNSLWALLSSDEFTTPLLRSWVPWIRSILTDQTRFMRRILNYHNCNPWLCNAADTALDQIVSIGVKEGHLKLEDR